MRRPSHQVPVLLSMDVKTETLCIWCQSSQLADRIKRVHIDEVEVTELLEEQGLSDKCKSHRRWRLCGEQCHVTEVHGIQQAEQT